MYVAITRHSHQRISFNGLRIQHYTGIHCGVLITEAPSILRIQHYLGYRVVSLLQRLPPCYANNTQSGVLITEAPSILYMHTVLHWATEWCPYYRGSLHTMHTTLHWDTEWCPYYRGSLHTMHTTLHWDTEWCPYYRGSLHPEVCKRGRLITLIHCIHYYLMPSLLMRYWRELGVYVHTIQNDEYAETAKYVHYKEYTIL